MTFDDLARPFRFEQVGEALRCIRRFDQIRIVADDAQGHAEARELPVRVLLFGGIVLSHVFRHEGREQAVALPDDEMRGVGGIDHVDRVDVARVFLADALEYPLGAGPLDPHRDAGEFRLEGLCDLLCDRQIDRSVVNDLAFLPGGFDQGRRDRRRLRWGGAERGGEHRDGGCRARCLEHIAP